MRDVHRNQPGGASLILVVPCGHRTLATNPSNVELFVPLSCTVAKRHDFNRIQIAFIGWQNLSKTAPHGWGGVSPSKHDPNRALQTVLVCCVLLFSSMAGLAWACSARWLLHWLGLVVAPHGLAQLWLALHACWVVVGLACCGQFAARLFLG